MSPPREVIERLIEAAIWAPNHHLTEPWRFHVLVGAARAAMGEAVARWLETVRDPDDPKQRGEIGAARKNLNRAPVIIVVSQLRSDDPVQDLEDYAACCCATQESLPGRARRRPGDQVANRKHGHLSCRQATPRPR